VGNAATERKEIRKTLTQARLLRQECKAFRREGRGNEKTVVARHASLMATIGHVFSFPVSGNLMVESSKSTDPIYTPLADYCEIGTNTFATLDG
jgi:hypothetical protein